MININNCLSVRLGTNLVFHEGLVEHGGMSQAHLPQKLEVTKNERNFPQERRELSNEVFDFELLKGLAEANLKQGEYITTYQGDGNFNFDALGIDEKGRIWLRSQSITVYSRKNKQISELRCVDYSIKPDIGEIETATFHYAYDVKTGQTVRTKKDNVEPFKTPKRILDNLMDTKNLMKSSFKGNAENLGLQRIDYKPWVLIRPKNTK